MMWLRSFLTLQLVRRVTKQHDPSLAALPSSIDLERRIEPVVLEEHADVLDIREQAGRIRDGYYVDGVLLVGSRWPADDDEVKILCCCTPLLNCPEVTDVQLQFLLFSWWT
jgi:hypothetical protein